VVVSVHRWHSRKMAMCFWFESTRGWAADVVKAREQAGLWAERAIAMEDADGQAHTVLGNVRLRQRTQLNNSSS
jgi:hypothetical protein